MRTRPNLRSLPLHFAWLIAAAACQSHEGSAATATRTPETQSASDAQSVRLMRDVAWLADDAQEGRRAGTEAGKRSGEWLAARCKELGLAPAGEQGFLQAFDVPLPVELGANSAVADVSRPDEVMPIFCSEGGEASGEVAWRGYGIVNGEPKWNDYAERCDGKIVLIVRGTPPEPPKSSEPADAAASAHGGNVQASSGWGNSGSLFLKVMNAKRNGAVAVLVAPHPSNASEPLPAFDHSRAAQAGIPALFVSHRVAAALAPGYDEATRAFDTGAANVAVTTSRAARVVADLTRRRGPAFNVLAKLPGERSDRCVVIGAHYDHLGWGGEGSLAPDAQGQVHNGADDNASGTAAVLEVARTLAAGPKPACDVIFALWSGEELGLLGSEHWAQHPTVPLAQVAANLNLDMVGRASSGPLAVLGVGSSARFQGWLEELAPRAGLELKISLSGQGVGGSDHQTFLKRKIPAVHFFTGVHPDYHKPTDDVERFDAAGAAKIANLSTWLIERAAGAQDLAWVEPPAPESKPGEARAGGFRVWFGTVPEYSYQGKGLLLAGTSAGSPAEKAGMLAGDVLVQVGDIEIETINDFMYALQTYKPGDVVLARFVRDGKDESVRVTLSTRDAQ
jgi:hypothetical protein